MPPNTSFDNAKQHPKYPAFHPASPFCHQNGQIVPTAQEAEQKQEGIEEEESGCQQTVGVEAKGSEEVPVEELQSGARGAATWAGQAIEQFRGTNGNARLSLICQIQPGYYGHVGQATPYIYTSNRDSAATVQSSSPSWHR